MREILWKKIEGYDYAVSSNGDVKRLATPSKGGTGRYARAERKVAARFNNKGYAVVDLYRDNKRKQVLVHRLVATAFIDNPDKLPCVNHKDENPKNNNACNLEWCTQKYNMNYGTVANRIGKANSLPVIQLRRDGGEIVKRYSSIIQAQRETGISNGSIGDCLHGRRKTAGGYLWRYEN